MAAVLQLRDRGTDVEKGKRAPLMGQKDEVPEHSQQDAQETWPSKDLCLLSPLALAAIRGEPQPVHPSCRQSRWQGEQSQPRQTPYEPVKQLFNVSPPKYTLLSATMSVGWPVWLSRRPGGESNGCRFSQLAPGLLKGYAYKGKVKTVPHCRPLTGVGSGGSCLKGVLT